MADFRKKPSGSQYRKRATDKLAQKKELLGKVPKLNTFFTKATKLKATESEVLVSEIQNLRDADITSVTFASTSCERDGVALPAVSDSVLASPQPQQENLNQNDHADVIRIPYVSDDPAEWVIDDTTRDYLLKNGVKQNSDADFACTRRQYADAARYLTKSLFNRTLVNGETRPRQWLVFSLSKRAVFCAPCRLFGKASTLATEGYSDWKNAGQRMKEHENSIEHRSATAMLIERKNTAGRIDRALVVQTEEEIQYWRDVLKRVAATVKSLAIRGLPFRGTDERFGNHSGNYIMSLELISEFDPFLNMHIRRYGNKGSGSTSYLSSTTCEEFIQIMAEKLTNHIVAEAKDAKYFSISVDSTPDISHVDQLAFIVRYITKEGSPVERFMKFIPNCGHKGEQLANTVLDTLKNYDLDVRNCRGQSYDNASNMSGIYSGLQARIKDVNPLAVYVPCAAHSLNLVGSCAAECCQTAITFFGIIQQLYNFFSASTHRWAILLSHLKPNTKVVKSLSQTRWSARHDACRSLCCSWNEILAALHDIAADGGEKPVTRSEASGLHNSLDRLETCFMALVWNDILERFHSVSKTLQSVNTELGTIVELYQSLVKYIEDCRDTEVFDDYERKAIEACGDSTYAHDTKRKRKRKTLFHEEKGNEVELSGRENFRVNVFIVIIDRLSTELKRRCNAYEELSETFDFLTKLQTIEPRLISEKSQNLQACYPGDIDDTFGNECLHLRAYLTTTGLERRVSALQLYTMLREKGFLDIYPNVDVALRILLCTPVSNCSAERSFSALKRVKNYLRSTTEESRLNALSILYIESDLLRGIDYNDVINVFAEKRVRRKQLLM